jgi:hypothetical protein
LESQEEKENGENTKMTIEGFPIAIIEAEGIDELLLWCTDGCPWCEPGIGVFPVTVRLGDHSGYIMHYRCASGHDWACSYDAEFAESLARSVIESYPKHPQYFWPPKRRPRER